MSDKTMKCTDWQHDLLNSTAAGCPTCHEPASPSAPETPRPVPFSTAEACCCPPDGPMDLRCPIHGVQTRPTTPATPQAAQLPSSEFPSTYHAQIASLKEQLIAALSEVGRLKKERDNWQRKYFEMERAQSRSIDQNGEHIKRIQRLERDKDEIRNDSTAKLSFMQAELDASQKKMDALQQALKECQAIAVKEYPVSIGNQYAWADIGRICAAAIAEERAKQ